MSASRIANPSENRKPGFLPNVHSFRAIAIFAVVATHALYDLEWTATNRMWAKVCVSVVQNGTVAFVFVAGFLFQHLLGRFRYSTYLSTKVRFVILPYVLVSLPYVLLQKTRHFGIFADGVKRSHGDLAHLAVQYLSGSQMPIPLWFIPMIAVYYLLAPVFVAIDRHPRWYWSLPPLLLLASFAHRPQHQTQLNQSLLYFLPVYLSGMFVSHFWERIAAWARRLRWPLLAVALACIAFEVAYRDRTGAIESATMFSTERGVFDVNLYAKLILSVVCLEALRGAPAWLHRVLASPAEMSFGIFFLHYYFVFFAHDLRVAIGSAPWAGGLVNLLLYTTVLVILSMAVVWVVRRVTGERSRYLVGC